jgi:molybdopterin converting factor small subunit
MRIHITSNFFVPGLEEKDSVTMERSRMTLRDFLEELSKVSPTPIEYIKPGAGALDPDDWEVDINGIPYQHCSDGLKTVLKDGDTVAIKILAMGGG